MYILWQEFQNLLKTTLSSFRKKYNFYSPGLNRYVNKQKPYGRRFCPCRKAFLIVSLLYCSFCFFPFQMYHYFFIQCRNAGSRKTSAKIHASTFDRQIPIYPNIGASTIPAMVLAAISSTPAVMAKLENPIP